MTLRLRVERFLLGLHGLALLRGWPFGDAAEADSHLAAMRQLLVSGETDGEPIVVDHSELQAGYEAWAQTYDDGDNALLSVEEPAIRGVLEGFVPGNALDAACGTGRLTAMLAELGHDVVGVDASAAMVSRARARGTGAEFLLGDLHDLPLDDASVRLAVCGLALSHIPDLNAPIGELARVVQPGGHVVVSDMHPLAVATGGQAFYRDGSGARGVVRNHVHWPGGYVAAARDAGMEVERLEELFVDEHFISGLKDPDVRRAAEVALWGLPVAWIWVFQRV